jgi:hypothetical protein
MQQQAVNSTVVIPMPLKKHIYGIFIVTALLLGACAQVGAPTGGPKDETPPKILKSIPQNFSTNYTGNSIVLTFDEFIQLKDVQNQLIISPPLEKKPVPKIKGKSIIIELEEELKEKYCNHHHYAPLLRPGEFASVDLHHTLLYKTAEKMLSTNTAWKQVELLEIQGACLQVLSPTYRLLHNILHSEIVDRNYQKGIIPLRELSDLVYTQYHYKQKLDWSLIETTFAQHGKQNILYSYLYLACRYLGMSFPEPMEPNLASRIHFQRCRS